MMQRCMVRCVESLAIRTQEHGHQETWRQAQFDCLLSEIWYFQLKNKQHNKPIIDTFYIFLD